MKIHITALVFLLGTFQCWAEEAPSEPAPSTTQQYWEKTKELYEQTKELGEGLLVTDTNALKKIIRYFYDQAKEAGEQVPADLMVWAREDIGQSGAWEYRVLEVKTKDAEALEKHLNGLCSKRWECFWIEETDTGRRYFLKKAGRSYLKNIPYGDLLKLLPGDKSE